MKVDIPFSKETKSNMIKYENKTKEKKSQIPIGI